MVLASFGLFSTFVLILLYFTILCTAYFCFILTLKELYKFQFNLFLTLTLTTFSRFSQNLLIFLTGLLQIKSEFIFELQAFLDNFGVFFGFCVYMTLVLFWAEQHYRRKNKEINTRTVHVLFYIIIAIFLFILVCIGIFFLAIDEFHPNSIIYRLIRLTMRIISTVFIVCGLLFYGLNLYVTIKQSEYKDSVSQNIYKKIGSLTIFCTLIYILFLFYNILTFILGDSWIYFEFKFMFKFIFSLVEIAGFLLLIFVCRPKNFLNCFGKYNKPIMFENDPDLDSSSNLFYHQNNETVDYVE
eukprot:gene460-6871_t